MSMDVITQWLSIGATYVYYCLPSDKVGICMSKWDLGELPAWLLPLCNSIGVQAYGDVTQLPEHGSFQIMDSKTFLVSYLQGQIYIIMSFL